MCVEDPAINDILEKLAAHEAMMVAQTGAEELLLKFAPHMERLNDGQALALQNAIDAVTATRDATNALYIHILQGGANVRHH